MVIPEGSTVEGRVAEVRKAGRLKGRSEINLSYERLIFPNGVSETIVASQAELDDTQKEEMDRKEGTILGEPTRKRDAAEIGAGAAIGAGIGAIAGGKKGAAIGAGVGGLIGLGRFFEASGQRYRNSGRGSDGHSHGSSSDHHLYQVSIGPGMNAGGGASLVVAYPDTRWPCFSRRTVLAESSRPTTCNSSNISRLAPFSILGSPPSSTKQPSSAGGQAIHPSQP